MTTLMYVQGPPLTPEEAALDAEFGRAYYGANDNPEESNRLMEALAAKGAITAHVELYNRYRWGKHLPRDAAAARRHLLEACRLSEETVAQPDPTPMACMCAGSAMMAVAEEYLYQNPLHDPHWDPEQVLEPNRDEGLKWLRKAASIPYRPAALRLADTLRADRSARDCSPEEIREIAQIYEEYHEIAHLGSFYCPDLTAADWPEDDRAKAVQWYVKGRTNGCEYCERALKEWEAAKKAHATSPNAIAPAAAAVREVTPATATPSSSSNRRDEGEWTLMGIILTPFALVLWAVIGGFLLWLVAAVQAITVPIIIGGFIIWLIVKFIAAWRSGR